MPFNLRFESISLPLSLSDVAESRQETGIGWPSSLAACRYLCPSIRNWIYLFLSLLPFILSLSNMAESRRETGIGWQTSQGANKYFFMPFKQRLESRSLPFSYHPPSFEITYIGSLGKSKTKDMQKYKIKYLEDFCFKWLFFIPGSGRQGPAQPIHSRSL